MFPKTLVWTWTDPATPSGSPAILAEILKWIPKGHAEVVCESHDLGRLRRQIEIEHPITRYAAHKLLWPFKRGSRQIRLAKYLVLPITILFGLWRIFRFRPDCLLTIYFNEQWILTSYCLSKLTGVPVVYYVHDPFEERARHEGTLSAGFARWLEPRSLKHGSVLVLYDSLRVHYSKKYGISPLVIRHLASRRRNKRRQNKLPTNSTVVIGFAGAIYDNNYSLIELLLNCCKQDRRLNVKLWTNANPNILERLGVNHPQVSVSFEEDYDRLLEELSKCDLLYLPLAFAHQGTLPADALRYVLPTKAVDYLLAGPPILVHCPPDFETYRFFSEHRVGYCLPSKKAVSLRAWLQSWLEGELELIDEGLVLTALDAFCRSKNLQTLGTFLEGICKKDYRKETLTALEQ